MSDWKDEWNEAIQSGGSSFHPSAFDPDGTVSFQRWVDGIKRDLDAADKESKSEVDDDCLCEACDEVTFIAWNELYPNDFELYAGEAYDELYDILISKQNDYGPNNIQNAPGGPLNGLQVRLYDKMSRLINLINSGAKPENESLRDTFVDIANYGVIGMMILDGTFPKAKD